MRFYPDIGPAAADVRRFFNRNDDELPEHVAKALQTEVDGGSPVDLIVRFVEVVYANRETLPGEAMEIAAGCSDLINQKGYHGRLDGRAAAMVDVLRRDSGERAATGHPWPKKADDPAHKQEFAAEPPPQAAEPPADTAKPD